MTNQIQSWTFGILDQQHLCLCIGNTGSGAVTVSSVNVWQNSTLYNGINGIIPNVLTVNSGIGSGGYTNGQTVTITANAAPAGQVFDKWVIDWGNPTITNTNAASTTLTMPVGAASVTATYAMLPQVYGSSMKITFAGYTQNETLTNFPILVKLSTNLPGFSYKQFASPAGGDLRFMDSSGTTLLNHEIDQWNTNGTSLVWVQVPTLSSNNSYIWAYWGDPTVTYLPASSTNGAVWANNSLSVWHLSQTPPASMLDSTANNNLATPSTNFPATNQISGIIGGSLYFNTNWLNVPHSIPSSTPLELAGGQFTLSAWVYLNASSDGVIIGNGQNGVVWYSWFLTVGNNPGVDQNNTANRLCVGFRSSNVSGSILASQTSNVVLSNWVYVAGTLDGSNLTLYVNGIANTTQATTAAPYYNGTQLWIGADLNRDYLNGQLDEVRVENVARSSNWVWACYMNEASNSTFATYSTVSRTQPALALGMNGSGNSQGLTFNWPANGVGFALYSSTNLAQPSSWSLVTNPPSLVTSNNVTQWQIAAPISTNNACYYRLMAQ